MRELADHLKSQREQRGLTLEDVSRQVSLSRNVLNAMEEGNFEKIGTPLLIRKFIASYCSALGIDSRELLEKYAAKIDSFDSQREGIQRYSEAQKVFRSKNRWGFFLFGVTVAVVALAFFGGLHIYEKRQSLLSLDALKTAGFPQQEIPADLSSKSTLMTRDGSEAPSVKENAVSADGSLPSGDARERAGIAAGGGADQRLSSLTVPMERSDSGEPMQNAVSVPIGASAENQLPQVAGTSPPAAAEQLQAHGENGLNRLTVRALQETWIQVRIDKTTTQSALLKMGDSREWTVRETIQIVLGNAGGVNMEWNGRPLKLPGKSGSVLRFRLPDPKYMAQE